MKPDFDYIIEIYTNASEKEKLIFIDVINDLIIWIPIISKAKKIPQSIEIEEIATDTIKEMNIKSVKEFNNFVKDFKDFIYKWTDIKDKQSWVFNITKSRIQLPKIIKEYYFQIWDDELDEIQDYRILFLKNLVECWFIEIFVSKNKEYHKLCEDYMNTITKLDNRNKRVFIWLNNIKDSYTRNRIEKIQIDYWVDEVKKMFETIFNDIKIKSYLCKKENLELLYSKITWKKTVKEYTEFFSKEWLLRYKWKDILFNIDEKPFLMLKYIFKNEDKEIWIDKIDLFKYIENTDSIELYYKNKHTLNDLKNWINRRFKNEFKTKKLFLRFKNSALYKEI